MNGWSSEGCGGIRVLDFKVWVRHRFPSRPNGKVICYSGWSQWEAELQLHTQMYTYKRSMELRLAHIAC